MVEKQQFTGATVVTVTTRLAQGRLVMVRMTNSIRDVWAALPGGLTVYRPYLYCFIECVQFVRLISKENTTLEGVAGKQSREHLRLSAVKTKCQELRDSTALAENRVSIVIRAAKATLQER